MQDNKFTINDRQIVVQVPQERSKVQNHNSKIPESLLTVIYKRRHEGATLEQLQVWLRDEHQIEITVSSLSRRMKKVSQLDKAVAQAIYLQSAAQGADEIVSIMNRKIATLDQTAESLRAQGLFSEARMYDETLMKYMHKKIDLVEMGNNQNKEDSGSSDIDELLSRMSASALPGSTVAITASVSTPDKKETE